MVLTERQTKILKIIIDEYTALAVPIGSKEIINKHLKNLSSATVRNDMAKLEEMGYLMKTHTSSGRIPSKKGYEFYEQHILKPSISNDIKNKLRLIFNQRNNSIDTVIDQSVSIINEIVKLPSVITTIQKNETLKRIDLIQIDQHSAIVILVTSSGAINKININFDNDVQLEDIAICIRVFNDRLVDTPIENIKDVVDSIKKIIKSKVHQYEFVMQELIEKIFDFNTNPVKNSIHGTKYIVSQPEFRDMEKLKSVLDMLENNNIWKQIAYNQSKTGRTSITFGSDIGNDGLSIASTSIEGNDKLHQISIVGPTRMNYSQIKGLLDFIKEEIENVYKKKENK